MSTVSPGTHPSLVAGRPADRDTFLEWYEQTSPDTRAELISGVVHIPGLIGRRHGVATVKVGSWLVDYERRTPGVEALNRVTTALDDLGVPEPDAILRILPEWGGQTRNEREIIAGPPELVIEVAQDTHSIDLGPKLADYDRAGVLEYLVHTIEPDQVIWHARREGRLTAVPPGSDGLYRSEAFPGLWLDPVALLADDSDNLIATLDRGLATPEHAEFVTQLNERHKSSTQEKEGAS